MKKPISNQSDMLDSLKPTKKEQAIIWLVSPVIVLTSWTVLIWICSQ
jgi:hypothetical protein